MDSKKLRNTLLNMLGALVTGLAVIILLAATMFTLGYTWDYIVRFWPEFLVVLTLTMMVRFFWYNSMENRELTSEAFETKTNLTIDAVNETIKDVAHFDKYLEKLTDDKRQKFIDNKLAKLTATNYKRTLWQRLRKLPIKDAFTEYKMMVERKANKLKPLNSNNFITLIDNDSNLLDDTNHAKRNKRIYQIGSGALTVVTTVVFALLAIEKGGSGAWIRSLIYIFSMLVSSGQAILTALTATRRDWISFYRRIVSILDSYRVYCITNPVKQPIKVEQISFDEVTNGNGSK